MTTPRMTVQGLTVERAGRPVVTDVSLEVPRGSVTVLLGANGAGKTTLMQSLSGVLPTRSGAVHLDGRDITRLRPVARARAGMASVEQGRTVFSTMSVADNLRIAGGDRDGVEQCLERFPELRPKLNTRAGLLSGGEQQMLMLARALVRRPSALLIDEMSLGLAPGVVRRILPLVRDLAEQQAIGVLLVEQFAVLALAVAERAYVLRRGVITFDGNAAELAADPHLLDVAYFGQTKLQRTTTGTTSSDDGRRSTRRSLRTSATPGTVHHLRAPD